LIEEATEKAFARHQEQSFCKVYFFYSAKGLVPIFNKVDGASNIIKV
jgi:hypothetical protein